MSDPFGLLEQARALFILRRYSDAEKKLQEVLAIDPMHVDALLILSNCKLNLQKIKEAKVLAEQVLGIEPYNHMAMALMAEAFARSGDPENARLHIRGALIDDSENPDYLASLSRYLLMLREEPAAVQTAMNALKIDPKHAPSLTALGLAKFELDDYEEALDAFQSALALDPNNALLLHHIGRIFRETGQTRGAKAKFLDALRNDPNLDVSALGVASVSYRENLLYRIHYYLLDIFKQSHITRLAFFGGAFLFFLLLAEAAWEDFPVTAKIIMIVCWVFLLILLSIFIIPAAGNLPVIFRQQYTQLFNWRARLRTFCIAILYLLSICLLVRGTSAENIAARWFLNGALLTLIATLLIQMIFGTQTIKGSIIILIIGSCLVTTVYLAFNQTISLARIWTFYLALFLTNIAGGLMAAFRKFQE